MSHDGGKGHGKGHVGFQAKKQEIIPESRGESEHEPATELTRLEVDLCRQNFQFYDKSKHGSVERFELPMLLEGNAEN